MENLFHNPALIKLQTWGQKLGTNKFISALQYGMMATMSILMVGAICQILAAVLSLTGLIDEGGSVYNAIYQPYHYTMGLIGLWATAFVAFAFARNLKLKNPVVHAIDAVVIFVLTCGSLVDGKIDTTFLDANGMFLGFVIAGVVVRIEKFCLDQNIRIPMPDVCPPSLVNAFAAIVPLLINVLIFHGLNVLLSIAGQNLPNLMMTVLMIPIRGLTSLPGMFIITDNLSVSVLFQNGQPLFQVFPENLLDLLELILPVQPVKHCGQFFFAVLPDKQRHRVR